MDELARKVIRPRKWMAALATAAAIALALAAGAGAAVVAGPTGAANASQELAPLTQPQLSSTGVCMVDRFNATHKGGEKTSLGCTSNDVRLATYTLVTGPTTCVIGDNVSVVLKGKFIATSDTRWDVGVFVSLDGGTPNDPGGSCYNDFLHFASLTNTDLNLTGGSGPFYNGELTGGAQDLNDTCGDIEQAQDAFLTTEQITIKCQDSDGDHVADVPSCTVWNNSGATTPSCTSEAQTGANTTAKCTCENVPISGLSVRPGLVTSATASVTVGETIKDTATLSGGDNPTGTISFSVYAPGDTTCATPLTPAPTSAAVSGNGSYSSGNFTTTAVGTYRWRAFYSGDAKNVAVSTACNDANESSTVVPFSPSLATTASPSTASSIGTVLNDSAAFSGFNPTGTLTFNLYPPSAPTCTGTPAYTQVVNVSGSGSYSTSPGFTSNAAGTWQWVVAYSGDANNSSFTSACGAANESSLIKTAPGISTAQDLMPNDSATITGATSDAGGTITFKLFSPSDATCSGTPALSQVVNVSGNGTYSTNNTTFHVTTVGTWRWLVEYSGDTKNDPATKACGVENFTITN